MKVFIKKHSIYFLAIFIFISLVVGIAINSEYKAELKTDPKTEHISINNLDVELAIQENYNDSIYEEVSLINSGPKSYWFVKYELNVKSTEVEMRGWMVILTTSQYFDTHEVVLKIYPGYKEEDYVGIDFFKQVPRETYESYIKDYKNN